MTWGSQPACRDRPDGRPNLSRFCASPLCQPAIQVDVQAAQETDVYYLVPLYYLVLSNSRRVLLRTRPPCMHPQRGCIREAWRASEHRLYSPGLEATSVSTTTQGSGQRPTKPEQQQERSCASLLSPLAVGFRV